MKKMIMAIVCLMTMVVNANAQDDVYRTSTYDKSKALDVFYDRNKKSSKINDEMSGIWGDINSDVVITFTSYGMIIKDKVKSLTLFNSYERYTNIRCYSCTIEFPGIGEKTIEARTNWYMFDSSHVIFNIHLHGVDIHKQYKLVKMD